MSKPSKGDVAMAAAKQNIDAQIEGAEQQLAMATQTLEVLRSCRAVLADADGQPPPTAATKPRRASRRTAKPNVAEPERVS